mmetsp:Transcript_10178/g.16674  ORF Transcript_10178/g.16674 Transcript_10178/m.16674 type:complete len:204 (+) Transcript_10178:1433-2044(+)
MPPFSRISRLSTSFTASLANTSAAFSCIFSTLLSRSIIRGKMALASLIAILHLSMFARRHSRTTELRFTSALGWLRRVTRIGIAPASAIRTLFLSDITAIRFRSSAALAKLLGMASGVFNLATSSAIRPLLLDAPSGPSSPSPYTDFRSSSTSAVEMSIRRRCSAVVAVSGRGVASAVTHDDISNDARETFDWGEDCLEVLCI